MCGITVQVLFQISTKVCGVYFSNLEWKGRDDTKKRMVSPGGISKLYFARFGTPWLKQRKDQNPTSHIRKIWETSIHMFAEVRWDGNTKLWVVFLVQISDGTSLLESVVTPLCKSCLCLFLMIKFCDFKPVAYKRLLVLDNLWGETEIWLRANSLPSGLHSHLIHPSLQWLCKLQKG